MSRRTSRALVALAGMALVAGCGSSAKSSSAADATSTSASVQTGSVPTSTQSGPDTTQSASSGKGFSAPCGLVTVADVQAVLPGAPAGTVQLASSTAAMCTYASDVEHKVNLSLATGPAIDATKAAVANLSGQTKVDGLGDVGYSSVKPTRLDVHFFKGNTEVLISAYGTNGGVDPLVALAKQVDAAL